MTVGRWADLRLAVTTFTVLPVRGGSVDRRAAGAAMRWAPAVGVVLGALLALVCRGLRAAYPGHLVTAAVAVGLLALLTRGLHLDGLADTVDGLGCYGDRERALAVMKAPDVGPFGVAAVVLVLLLDTTALQAALAADRGWLALPVALGTGRLAVTWACTPRTPAARPDGLGGLVAGTTTAASAAALTAVGLAAAALTAGLTGHHPVEDVARVVVAVVGPLAVAHGLRAHAVRRFGGVTGDVLGALVEVTTVASLLVLAAGLG